MKKGCLVVVALFVVVVFIGTLSSDKSAVTTTPQTAADTAKSDAERAHMTFGKVYHTVDGAPAC